MHETAPGDKQVLRLNLDETSIKLYQDPGKGFITADMRWRRKRGRTKYRPVSRGQMRTAFTHVAIICDDVAIQAQVPQVLVINTKTVSEAVATRIRSSLPPAVVLWRRKSAWLDTSGICAVLRLVAKKLAVYKPTHTFLLGLDAARIHLTEQVWKLAGKLGFLMYCIPAKLTSVLQPCDVYVFALYKWKLKQAVQELHIRTRTEGVSLEHTITGVVEAINAIILGRCWKHAFTHLGLSGSLAEVSLSTLRKLHYEAKPVMSPGMPSLEDLQSCFPKNSIIPIDAVFAGVVSIVTPPRVPFPRALAARLWGRRPRWIGRTRASLPVPSSEAAGPAGVSASAGSGDPWPPTLRLARLPSRGPSARTLPAKMPRLLPL